MTIIVYRDGVLAADDLVSHMPDGMFSARTIKIAYRKKDKALIAGAGAMSDVEKFIRAALKGQEAKITSQEFTGVIAKPNGVVQEWNGGSACNLYGDYYACGWGSSMAIGALAQGASAPEAAKIVCRKYGWPADLHVVTHDGEFFQIPRSEEPLHENARQASADELRTRYSEPKRRANRKPTKSRAGRNGRTKKPVRRSRNSR